MNETMTRAQETKAVKALLIKEGYDNVNVSHGKGTAWGWLHVKVRMNHPADCLCHLMHEHRYCLLCTELRQGTDIRLMAMIQELTGRHGEYDNICLDLDYI